MRFRQENTSRPVTNYQGNHILSQWLTIEKDLEKKELLENKREEIRFQLTKIDKFLKAHDESFFKNNNIERCPDLPIVHVRAYSFYVTFLYFDKQIPFQKAELMLEGERNQFKKNFEGSDRQYSPPYLNALDGLSQVFCLLYDKEKNKASRVENIYELETKRKTEYKNTAELFINASKANISLDEKDQYIARAAFILNEGGWSNESIQLSGKWLLSLTANYVWGTANKYFFNPTKVIVQIFFYAISFWANTCKNKLAPQKKVRRLDPALEKMREKNRLLQAAATDNKVVGDHKEPQAKLETEQQTPTTNSASLSSKNETDNKVSPSKDVLARRLAKKQERQRLRETEKNAVRLKEKQEAIRLLEQKAEEVKKKAAEQNIKKEREREWTSTTAALHKLSSNAPSFSPAPLQSQLVSTVSIPSVPAKQSELPKQTLSIIPFLPEKIELFKKSESSMIKALAKNHYTQEANYVMDEWLKDIPAFHAKLNKHSSEQLEKIHSAFHKLFLNRSRAEQKLSHYDLKAMQLFFPKVDQFVIQNWNYLQNFMTKLHQCDLLTISAIYACFVTEAATALESVRRDVQEIIAENILFKDRGQQILLVLRNWRDQQQADQAIQAASSTPQFKL